MIEMNGISIESIKKLPEKPEALDYGV